MKTKRLLALILTFVLCVGMLFALTACNQDGGGEEPEIPKITGVTFKSATYDYDGTPKKIEVQGLPEGATVTYSPSNEHTDIGTYLIKATVKLNGYQDLELSARLIIKDPNVSETAKVTFDTDGATVIEGQTSVTVNKGESVAAPANIVKNGYSLIGWYNGNEKWDFDAPVSEDMTLTAKWELVEYTVTYVIDHDYLAFAKLPDNPANPISFTVESEDIILVGATITDIGYGNDFDGWYIKSGGKEIKVEKISAGTSMNLTLYAKFKTADYTVTYDLNGGVNDEDNLTTYNKETALFTLLPATKEHYDFVAWVDAESNPVTEIAGGSSGNITLTATYVPKPYEIEYVMNGGVNAPENPATYDIETAVTLLPATKAGSMFAGWYAENDITSEKIETIALGTTGKVTVYAIFEAYPFIISYNPMGGTLPEENPTGYDPAVGVASFNSATKAGHTFIGWYSSPEFNDGELVTEIPAGTEQNFVLYAKFVLGTEGIAYNEVDGEYTVTGYTGTATEVIIPESIDGKPVTAIGAGAFAGSSVTKVTLPATLASIGEGAFEGCAMLDSIVIPEDVEVIGANAFLGCTALEVINCKALTKPAGYAEGFNKLNETELIEVVYAYTGEDDTLLPPQPMD